MTRVLALACLVLLACDKKEAPPASDPVRDTPKSETPAPVATPPDAAPPPPAKPMLQLQLRSTPAGAEAHVDGRPAGRTPVVVDVPDDGKEHELVFLLPGYAMERYRTRPVKSGVVHARLKPAPVGGGDAGR